MIRQLPYKERAEQDALGAVLLDPVKVHDLTTLLRADDFYLPAHREIFAAMATLAAANKMPDVGLVIDELRRSGGARTVDLAEVSLGDLARNAGSPDSIAHYCAIVREAAKKRAVIKLCAEAQAACYGEGERGAADEATLLPWFEQEVFKITNADVRTSKPWGTLVREELTNMEERGRLPEGALLGVPSGIVQLDKLIGGWHPGHVIVIAGRPAMGKSAAAINNCALDAAVIHRVPTLIFSMEMSAPELIQRQLAAQTRIPLEQIRTGKLDQNLWCSDIYPGAEALAAAPIEIDERGNLSAAEIASRMRQFRAKLPPRPADAAALPPKGLVVIDYMQLARGDDPKHREQEVAQISRTLKAAARDTSLPLIVVSQLNRGTENRPNKRPGLADLRESGAIEQDADLVIFLYRGDYYEDKEAVPGTAEWIVAKNRHGPTKTVITTWRAAFTRFENRGFDD